MNPLIVVLGTLTIIAFFVWIMIWALKADAKDAKAYGTPPEDGRERLKWQAERGNHWAQHVLDLEEGQRCLFGIIHAYKDVLADAGVELVRENPTHLALDAATDEYHNWIARAYNKEEC